MSLTYSTCEPTSPNLLVRAEQIYTPDKLQSMRWFVKNGAGLLKAVQVKLHVCFRGEVLVGLEYKVQGGTGWDKVKVYV